MSLALHYQGDGYPFTAAEFLLAISIGTGVVSIVTAWIGTTGSRAKWRQRFLVVLFSTFPIGWAWLQFPIRDHHLNHARAVIESWESKDQDEMSDYGESRLKELRGVLESFEALND